MKQLYLHKNNTIIISKMNKANKIIYHKIKEPNHPLPKRGEKIPIVDFHPDKNEIYFRGKKVGTAKQQNNELIDIEFDNDFLMKYGYPSSYRLPYE